MSVYLRLEDDGMRGWKRSKTPAVRNQHATSGDIKDSRQGHGIREVSPVSHILSNTFVHLTDVLNRPQEQPTSLFDYDPSWEKDHKGRDTPRNLFSDQQPCKAGTGSTLYMDSGIPPRSIPPPEPSSIVDVVTRESRDIPVIKDSELMGLLRMFQALKVLLGLGLSDRKPLSRRFSESSRKSSQKQINIQFY